MKRKNLLFYILVLSTASLKAQSDSVIHEKRSISFSIGEGVPLGDYGRNYDYTTGETDLRKVGYANTGPQLDITTRFRIKNYNTWFILMAGLNINSFDANMYAVNATNLNFESRPAPQYWSVTINNENAGDYVDYSFLAGISTHIPYGRFSLEFRFLAGLLYCQFPNVSYSGTYYILYSYGNSSTSIVSENIQSKGSFGFAGDFGLTTKYALGNRYLLLLNGDILHSSTTIFQIISPSIWLFNYSVGIGYKF